MKKLLILSLLSLSFIGLKADPQKDLFEAAMKGDVQRADQALKAGANIDALETIKVENLSRDLQEEYKEAGLSETAGLTPLMAAALEDQYGMVHFLLNKDAKPDAQNNDGTTALIIASKYDDVVLDAPANYKMVELLLKRGAKPNVADHNGDTPLIYAAEDGYFKLAELLVAHGADVKVANNEGETALDFAALYCIDCTAESKKDRVQLIKFLISKGAIVTDRLKNNELIKEAQAAK